MHWSHYASWSIITRSCWFTFLHFTTEFVAPLCVLHTDLLVHETQLQTVSQMQSQSVAFKDCFRRVFDGDRTASAFRRMFLGIVWSWINVHWYRHQAHGQLRFRLSSALEVGLYRAKTLVNWRRRSSPVLYRGRTDIQCVYSSDNDHMFLYFKTHEFSLFGWNGLTHHWETFFQKFLNSTSTSSFFLPYIFWAQQWYQSIEVSVVWQMSTEKRQVEDLLQSQSR